MGREIQTSLYAPLLPPGCEDCRARDCSRSYGLDRRGRDCRGDDPQAVVTWPACPWTWGALWVWGAETLPPAEVCRWLWETGVQHDPLLSAAGASLLRRWSAERELPARLSEARRIADDDDRREQERLARGGRPRR